MARDNPLAEVSGRVYSLGANARHGQGKLWGAKACSDGRITHPATQGGHLRSSRRSCRALLATSAVITAAAVAPAAANAAVSVAVTGDDGSPIGLGGTLNIRNMSPKLTVNAAASDNWTLSVTGTAPRSRPTCHVARGH